MRSFLTFNIALFCSLFVSAQSYNPNISAELDKINRSVQLVQTFQDFGDKTVGSEPIKKTANWLVNEYTSYGYDSVRVDSFEQGGKTYRNVVVTKKGLSDEVLLVCGHYDTRNGPGANDNGTGVAAILETARIIQSLSTERGVIFINFDGEEEGYTGSQYYVNNQLGTLDGTLYLVLNVDQIGGTNGATGNDKLKCERDEYNSPSTNNGRSWAITDTITKLTGIYTDLEGVVSNAFGSDYVPFEEQGVVITGLYQNATDLYSHRPSDTLGNIDSVSFKQAVRAAAAATIYFAQVPKFVGLPEVHPSQVKLYPNPSTGRITIDLSDTYTNVDLKLIDMQGKIVDNQRFDSNSPGVHFSGISEGLYLLHLAHPQMGSVKQLLMLTSP